jgi:AcrR family transcriptional regulator
MDARARRTRELLERTILDLAAQRPLTQISVTDVARAAGITRPTFYAHADSPGDLLALVLGRQLEAVTSNPNERPIGAWDETPGRALVHHVMENAPIYRLNLTGRLPHEMRNVLIDHTERVLIAHFLRHAEALPVIPGVSGAGPDDGSGTAGSVDDAEIHYRRSALYAEIVASGTVAALEAWLRQPDPLDPEWATRAIRLGSPRWVQEPATGPAAR